MYSAVSKQGYLSTDQYFTIRIHYDGLMKQILIDVSPLDTKQIVDIQ